MSAIEASPLYRVRDWNKYFENNRTRDLKKLDWVPVPNKMDGGGYCEFLDCDEPARALGVWLSILEIASKCDPRGTLVRHSGIGVRDSDIAPHTARTMSWISRLKESEYLEVIPRLVKLGWLEEIKISHKGAGISHEGARIPHEGALNEGREGREGKEPCSDAAGSPKPPKPKASKKPHKDLSDTSDHHKVIKVFCDCWRDRYGVDYAITAKDGKAAKDMLAALGGKADEAVEVVRRYVDDNDNWICERRHSLWLLTTRINEYRGEAPSHDDTGGIDFSIRGVSREEYEAACRRVPPETPLPYGLTKDAVRT